MVEDADETPSGSDAMTASGTIDFIDLNWADTHSVTVVAPLAGAIGTLAASVANASTGDGQGQVTWQYTLDDAASQYLAADETKLETFIVTITDSTGRSVSQAVTITIQGTNDGVTISAADASGAVTKDATDPTLSDSGTITFDDLDLSDAHSASVAADPGNTLGGVLTAVVDPLDPATGLGSGTVNWSYSVANSATQYLAVGQSVAENFTVSIADGHGGTLIS